MDSISEIFLWGWLIAGILLVVSELLLPGLIAVFLGMAALSIFTLLWVGIIQSATEAFTWWFIISLGFLFFLRGIFQKLMPGEETYTPINKYTEAFGEVVDVIETVTNQDENGRIRFHGSTWSATCEEEKIEKGEKAVILTRKDMVWIIKPYYELDSYKFSPHSREDGNLSRLTN